MDKKPDIFCPSEMGGEGMTIGKATAWSDWQHGGDLGDNPFKEGTKPYKDYRYFMSTLIYEEAEFIKGAK